ncbi:hypothetical protein [Ameyamaea chiangmaiensis]|uniref:hypothetical protein n=1 Tax=Ameyamaea chiangmaiensis TaxID=442969 RepID=UPI001FE7C469|nr:hypothetical protein [Ameyamaea chiangmaiensis]
MTRKWSLLALVAGVLAGGLQTARADDDDEPKKPSMHQLAAQSGLPKAYRSFEKFRYRPEGDKVIEQPENNRLLFWTRSGQPDGYAEQRGNTIFYYDRNGHAVRVQPLDDD